MQELKDVLWTVPEIEVLVGREDADKIMSLKECDLGSGLKSTLQSAFARLMTASRDMVSEAIAQLINRLNTERKVKHFLKPLYCGLLQFIMPSVLRTYFIIFEKLLIQPDS
jgi:hypothetical protein